MKAESLIFDIDGTLWDSRALVAEGYNIQLAREGREELHIDAEMLRPLFGKTQDELAQCLFPSVPYQERLPLMLRCMETQNEHMKEDPCQVGYPNLVPVLRELAKRHRLFIVSNSNQGYPELCMEKLGMEELFQGHLCFGDTLTVKGETIKTLMKTHDIHSAVYIGDTQGDADAADLAGLPFIWASYGFGSPDHWDEKLESPEDLLKIF